MNYCAIAYTIYENDYRVRRYAESLVDGKNKIDVYVLRKDNSKKTSSLNGVRIHRVQKKIFTEKDRLKYLLRILRFFIVGALKILIKQFKYRYSVIHVHNVPDFYVFMTIIPKMLGAKIILDIHDILPEFYCQKFGQPIDSLFAKVLFFLEKFSVEFADHVIVANDIWREKIIARHNLSPRKCTTLLNYPNLKFFEDIFNVPRDGKLKLIYPGTISYHHGIDIAIKAIALVKKQIPFVIFDIYAVGAPKIRQYLVKMVEDLNLCKNIKFHDVVKLDELNKIYQDVDFGLVPKRGGPFASEAFSTKIFDFMAAGIPVIVSRTKIDKYYFDESVVMFFEPENPENLAEKIIELYKDPEKARSLSKNAKKYVNNNNWQTKKYVFLDIVYSLMKNKYQLKEQWKAKLG